MAKTDDSAAALQLLVVIDQKKAKDYRTEAHGAAPVIFAPYETRTATESTYIPHTNGRTASLSRNGRVSTKPSPGPCWGRSSVAVSRAAPVEAVQWRC